MQVILFIAALFGVQPFYEQWLGDHDPLTSLRVARSWAEPWMFLTSPSQAACKPSICAVAERMAWNRNDFAVTANAKSFPFGHSLSYSAYA